MMDESATSSSVISDSRHHSSLQLQIQNLPATMFLQEKSLKGTSLCSCAYESCNFQNDPKTSTFDDARNVLNE